MASFFKTSKRAPAKGKGHKTREEAAQDIFKYIELYCSTVRMCSAHDYDSPWITSEESRRET